MISLTALHSRVESAASRLRAYKDGEAAGALVAWLDAAGAYYREQLVDVSPVQLAGLQAQVKQLEALRALACGAVQMNGCI